MKTISSITILAMLFVMVSPAMAELPQVTHGEPTGWIVGDLGTSPDTSLMSFVGSNGFSIDGRIVGEVLIVTVSDNLEGGEQVTFEVTLTMENSETTVRFGESTLVHRVTDGEYSELEFVGSDGQTAQSLGLRQQFPEILDWNLAMMDYNIQEDVMANADFSVIEALVPRLRDQASTSFWIGMSELTAELEASEQVLPAECFFVCLGCVGAIINWIARVGFVGTTCGVVGPACIFAVLAMSGSGTLLFGACGACGVCLDRKNNDDGNNGPVTGPRQG
jgi:hypothetical protein